MRKIIFFLTVLFGLLHSSAIAQQNKKMFGLVNKKNVQVNGCNVGLFSLPDSGKNNFTNGVKLELIGVGIGVPLIPRSPIFETDSAWCAAKKEPLTERVNGFSLALSGTLNAGKINGVTAGVVGNLIYRVNGISTAGMMNFVQGMNGIMLAGHFNAAYKANGAQFAIFGNDAVYLKGIQVASTNFSEHTYGLQIGLFNKSNNLQGIQLGLWNVNQRRKLPIVNWNFKRNKA